MSPNAAPATKSHTPTSPKTAPATQNASHDWSASHMKRHLECAEQAKSTSNLSKYCPCHAKWISWLIRASYATSFPMRRASKVNFQPQQILRLPRKMNPMINPRHTWNVIYNARRHAQSATNLTKYCACHEICKFKTSAETPWIASANRKTIRRRRQYSTMIRAWNRHLAPAASETLPVRPRTRFCIEKYISRSGYLPKCHQMLRLPRKVTLQLHQILRLARKMQSTLLYTLFSLGIYSLYASILPRHLFSQMPGSPLLYSVLLHLFSLGIYSL